MKVGGQHRQIRLRPRMQRRRRLSQPAALDALLRRDSDVPHDKML
jgi:hypothetical protein